MQQGLWGKQNDIIAVRDKELALIRKKHMSFSENSKKAICTTAESDDKHKPVNAQWDSAYI